MKKKERPKAGERAARVFGVVDADARDILDARRDPGGSRLR